MLSKPVKDCGCGGGKSHCISKPENKFRAWVRDELKRLDCGCGCKGRKGFEKKYGRLIGGAILADCPPGWRNDGLTCVENCKDNEKDDGLTCRKKCDPGWIDDGLTCRKPITSSMNSCPEGSRDIAGTCWGPVRRDCIDDCFKHPAPGCRSWWCGRLRGAFGEDWGPKLCTACNGKCGQTCWDVQGITKQLHQRELKLAGGEVIGQTIRGKQIRGRVNWNELGKVLETGIKDLMEGNIDLAAAFDPERNGVAAAFRKFGDDMKGALEEVGRGIKAGFDKMGADAKRAFEELARNAERDFKQFGDEFVRAMKDPDFWTEVAAIWAEVALTAAAMVVTATGVGAALAPGLLAAAAMAGPSIRMISNASQGRPIDVLDIVELAVAGASAAIPGMSGFAKTALQVGTNAAKIVVAGVKIGQDLGMIPSSCLGPNCPPPPPKAPFPASPPFDPPFPGVDIPGQLTVEEIAALQPANTIRYQGGRNPDYLTPEEWIEQYRAEHYGGEYTESDTGALISPEDNLIEETVNVPVVGTPTEIPNAEELFDDDLPPMKPRKPFVPFNPDAPVEAPQVADDLPPMKPRKPFVPFNPDAPVETPQVADDLPPMKPRKPFVPFNPDAVEVPQVPVPIESPKATEPTRIISEEELEGESFIPRAIVGGLRGGTNIESLPIIDVNINGDEYSNPFGEMKSTLPKSTAVIPLTHTGANFDPTCYAAKNPEIAKETNNDKDRLTTHWIEIGSKEGLNADCGNTPSTLEQRLAGMAEFEKNREKLEGMKTNCAATDRFWVETENRCDGHRHKDGRPNTEAADCLATNSFWDTSEHPSYCNGYLLPDGKYKNKHEICNFQNNSSQETADGIQCSLFLNVDKSRKTKSDACTGLDGFWTGTDCDFKKDKAGKTVTNKQLCNNAGNFFGRPITINKAAWGKQHWGDWGRSIDVTENIRKEVKMRKNGLLDELYIPPFSVESLRNKYKWKDVHPYNHKVLDIWWNDGTKDRHNAHIEYQSFPELAPAPETQVQCFEGILSPSGQQRPASYLAHVNSSPIKIPTTILQKGSLYMRMVSQGLAGSSKPKSLTLYWAEWCPHCHDLMPEWEKLGKGYKGITIEAIEEQDSDVKVNGYPTIIFRDGKNMEKYEGDRTKNAILNFLKNKLSKK